MGSTHSRVGLVVSGLVALACGCGPGNLASNLAKPPEYDPEGQTQCKIKMSQEKPLIVEWPSADRTELEANAKGSVVVVSYNGCEMRLLSHCKAPGQYAYTAVTPKDETERIQNEDDLYAKIPMGAAKFESKLATAGQLNVTMTMVGRYVAEQVDVDAGQLTGHCDGATHIISGLTVGAFEFFAGADAEVGASAEVMDVGAGAKSTAKRETLTRDGTPAACRQVGDFSGAPPPDCAALLRVEVMPLLTPKPGTVGSAPAGVAAASKAGDASARTPSTATSGGQGPQRTAELSDDQLWAQAGRLAASGKSAEARVAYRRLVEDHPNSRHAPAAYLAIGDLHAAAKDSSEAIAAYDTVTQRFGGTIEERLAKLKLGWTYLDLARDYRTALESFAAALRLAETEARARPKDDKIAAEARRGLVSAYSYVGRADQAEAFFRKMSGDDPSDSTGTMAMLDQLAQRYAERGYVKEEAIIRTELAKLEAAR